MLFDPGQLLPGHGPVERVDLGRPDQRPVALGHELDALGRGIRPLVKLTGQEFHREDRGGAVERRGPAGDVHLGFGKDRGDRRFKERLGDVFRIVAVQDPDLFQAGDPQKAGELPQKALGLLGKGGLFLCKNSVNHQFSLAARARLPMSRR